MKEFVGDRKSNQDSTSGLKYFLFCENDLSRAILKRELGIVLFSKSLN